MEARKGAGTKGIRKGIMEWIKKNGSKEGIGNKGNQERDNGNKETERETWIRTN